MKKNLFGLTLTQLEDYILKNGFKRYNANQIAQWMYSKSIPDFEKMTNLSKDLREFLRMDAQILRYEPSRASLSKDGTKKYLFPYQGSKFIETAYIPDEKRNTLCVSSQVGCKMGCLFCMTARQGFQGNLTSGEIINQLVSIPDFSTVTNLVYMGMGEPMDNIEAVLDSLEVLTSDWGYGFSPKKITVSTIGILPGIETFLKRSRCHLAISVHSPFEAERKTLMPIETVYSIESIFQYLRSLDWEKSRKISIEYIVFKGINHTKRHAKALAGLLNGLSGRINLIPYHPVPGTDLKGASRLEMEEFQAMLKSKGIRTTIRKSRGLDIDAACGLLSTKEMVKQEERDF